MAQVNITFARWNDQKEQVDRAYYIHSLPENVVPNFVAIKKKGHEAFPPVRGWSYEKSEYFAGDSADGECREQQGDESISRCCT